MREGVLRWDVWLGILLGLGFYFVPAAVNPRFDAHEENSRTPQISQLVEEEEKIDTSNVFVIAAFSAVIGSIATFILDRLWLIPRWLRKRREAEILEDLAEMRGEGIQIMIGGKTHKTPADRDKWIAQAEDWKERLYAKVAGLSKSEARNLRDVSPFPPVTVHGVTDGLQLNKLGDLTETILRLKELTDTYR